MAELVRLEALQQINDQEVRLEPVHFITLKVVVVVGGGGGCFTGSGPEEFPHCFTGFDASWNTPE